MFKKMFGGLVIALGFATAASSEPIPIPELSSYLNGMQASTASFTQVDDQGRTHSGKFYVQRPYRMRFEYETQPVLLLGSGGQVAVFDNKNSGPQIYPMTSTPLSLILAPSIDLAKQGAIVGHGEVNGHTIVTLKDPSGKTSGSIELAFAPGPVLSQWVATDDMGRRTTVILKNLKGGMQFKPSTFAIQSEIDRRK